MSLDSAEMALASYLSLVVHRRTDAFLVPPPIGAYLLRTLFSGDAGIVEMDELARRVDQSLRERGFCVVFEDELERCWPSEKIDLGDREETIQSFAKSRGWIVSVLNSESGGTRALFESHGRTAGQH